jgi:hypothetical protein
MTEIVLFKGGEDHGEEDDYLPALLLDHDADRSELYVIVGEETDSMSEGVPTAAFEEVARRIKRLEAIEKIVADIERAGGGSIVLHYVGGKGADWSLMSVFGEEEEGSPMAGGSHIGAGGTFGECLASAVK